MNRIHANFKRTLKVVFLFLVILLAWGVNVSRQDIKNNSFSYHAGLSEEIVLSNGSSANALNQLLSQDYSSDWALAIGFPRLEIVKAKSLNLHSIVRNVFYVFISINAP